MKIDINHQFIYSLLEKNGIFRLLCLKSKYKSAYVDMICFDYNTLSNPLIHHSPLNDNSNFYIKILTTLLAALVSHFRTCLINIRYSNKEAIDQDIILLPFADKIIRFKYIHSISKEPIAIQYPPLWHFDNIKRHLAWYEQRGESVCIGSFGFANILKSFLKLLANLSKIKKCSLELDSLYNSNNNNFAFRITMSLLYDGFARKMVNNIGNRQKNKIWLLDYDLDYKYIIFNNVIKTLRRQDKTVHLQHGAFVTEVESYCNPVSDYSLCCCGREKDIILKNNRYSANILVLGAPFQTFQNDLEKEPLKVSENYDVTVLMTDTEETALKLQKQVLEKLKSLNLKILLRYRPSSKDIDAKRIGNVTKGMVVSQGSTLLEDIISSNLVLSFSEDALYDCIRNNKATVFCLPDSYDYHNLYDFRYPLPEGFVICNGCEFSDVDVDRMSHLPQIQFDNDDFITFNFGISSFSRLRDRFDSVIKQIKEDRNESWN